MDHSPWSNKYPPASTLALGFLAGSQYILVASGSQARVGGGRGATRREEARFLEEEFPFSKEGDLAMVCFK